MCSSASTFLLVSAGCYTLGNMPKAWLFSLAHPHLNLHACTGLTATLATFILGLFSEDPQLTATNDILKWVFLLFPNYCLGRGSVFTTADCDLFFSCCLLQDDGPGCQRIHCAILRVLEGVCGGCTSVPSEQQLTSELSAPALTPPCCLGSLLL